MRQPESRGEIIFFITDQTASDITNRISLEILLPTGFTFNRESFAEFGAGINAQAPNTFICGGLNTEPEAILYFAQVRPNINVFTVVLDLNAARGSLLINAADRGF